MRYSLLVYVFQFKTSVIWLFFIMVLLKLTHSAIPVDMNGLPISFSVDAYASSLIYSFVGEMYGTKLVYSGQHSERRIYWLYGQTWVISNTVGSNSVFAQCSEPILHTCKTNIVLKYCITATVSNGYYKYYSLYEDKWVLYKNDTIDDRFVYYNSTYNAWVISNSVGGNTIYAQCNQTNFFNCNGTGSNQFGINVEPFCLSANPTVYPTLEPSIPSIAPTNPSIWLCETNPYPIWCYNIDIYPNNAAITTTTINITDINRNSD
eukprot:454052_1